MKKIFLAIIMVMFALTSNATLRQARLDARFLTDRMAYELNFDANQFEDVYEVNVDFIYKMSFFIDDVVRGYNDAIEKYYDYLDQRNRQLSYILDRGQYERFINIDYFYRPIYTDYRGWYYRILHVYPNRNFYYYNQPANYFYAIGEHYDGNYYINRYNHERYGGEYSIHRYGNYEINRRSDFGINTRDRGFDRPNSYNNRNNYNRTSDPRYQHRYNNNNINTINTPNNGNTRNHSNGNINNNAGTGYHIGNGARPSQNNNNNTGIGNGATVTPNRNTGY